MTDLLAAVQRDSPSSPQTSMYAVFCSRRGKWRLQQTLGLPFMVVVVVCVVCVCCACQVMVDLFELLVLFMVHYPVSAKRAKRARCVYAATSWASCPSEPPSPLPWRDPSASSTSRADSGGQYYGAPGMGGGRFGDALSLVAPSFLNRKKLPPTLLYTDVQRQKLRSPYVAPS